MELTKFSGLIEKVFSDNDKYSFYCNLVLAKITKVPSGTTMIGF